MLGSPFDLSKEIAAIAARREVEATSKGAGPLADASTIKHLDRSSRGRPARRYPRIPAAVTLEALI